MGNNAHKIGDFLIKPATRSVDYLQSMANLLVDFISKIVEVIADIGTILGVPEAGGDAAELVSMLLTAIMRIADIVIDDLQAATANIQEVVSGVITDNSKFPDGHWPQLVRNKPVLA